MPRISITKRFTFETAHFLPKHEGKCKGIHGHSYKLFVTVSGPIISEGPSDGMIMDFTDLKQVLKPKIEEWDHALLIESWEVSPLSIDQARHSPHKIIVVGYTPTAENMVEDLASFIEFYLHPSVKLMNVQLWETEDSYAEWTRN